ncbi:MAG TPA: hypothetical protein VMT24_01080 [Aggregatilineaceae bacterium]|nr:hypothetical protein [Aggregatilineaceae bacterium]
MPEWETLNCANHPDRIALERCEVCGKPLCAYCLYYTEDGQRLCQEHADEARLMGAQIEEPAAYADQLVGAQIGALRKHKRGEGADGRALYQGNSHDLMGLIGLLVGTVSVGACCGVGYCLPVVGLVLSLVAVINAKSAYDPRRTRKLGLIGMAVSGVWVLVFAACIAVYGVSLRSALVGFQNPRLYLPPTPVYATRTPPPTATEVPFSSPTATGGESSAWLLETPVPGG